jgi:RHS repeat-associated protein
MPPCCPYKTQVQQKRYRYTGKEKDDRSDLSYYGARYLAPWMARWTSPDSAGAVDGLNLYGLGFIIQL